MRSWHRFTAPQMAEHEQAGLKRPQPAKRAKPCSRRANGTRGSIASVHIYTLRGEAGVNQIAYTITPKQIGVSLHRNTITLLEFSV